MVQKRSLYGEVGDGTPPYQATQQRNQRFKFTKYLCKDKLWLHEYSAQLENVIRKVVREEVEQAVQRNIPSISRSLQSPAEGVEPRKFKLNFEGKLPARLYSGNKVEAEGPSPFTVSLLDAVSGRLISDAAPLSASKVRIVVLHGDFRAEKLQDWTQKEFNSNIVFARDGRRPLVVGECVIALHNGIGFIEDICITDNSSWVKSKRFRLGAIIEGKEDLVREGVSDSFEVKDRRGELYQKHEIPSPEDEVWRLCGIAKGGKLSTRLAEHHIYKVKDFLTQYRNDESLLRSVLGVSPKKWEAIVQRATSCLLLQQFCVPLNIRDHPEIQMPQYHATEYSHDLLDQVMAMNQQAASGSNFVASDSVSLENMLAASYNDALCCPVDHFMAPSSPTGPFYEQNLYDFQTSGLFPGPQPMWQEGNDFCMGSTSNFNLGAFSSIPNVGDIHPEIAKSKVGWSKIRAVWKMLIKHDEAAVKKGKFPCYSQ